MPRTRQDTHVYYWADGQVYGPERCQSMADALGAWDKDVADDPDRPRQGLCILDEVNHVAYIRPDDPNSVASLEKMTKKMLTRSGRIREAKWTVKVMEKEK
jgi:hypothetical protein